MPRARRPRPSPSTSPERPELRASPSRAPPQPVFVPEANEVREPAISADPVDSEGEDIRDALDEEVEAEHQGEEAREGGADGSPKQGEEAHEGSADAPMALRIKAMKPVRAAPRAKARIRQQTLLRHQRSWSMK